MKNQQKGSANIALIVLVILLALVVIYLAFIKKDAPVQKIQSTNLNTQLETDQPDANGIVSTKYQSTKTGYEINYPSNWVVVSQSESVNYGDFKIKNSPAAILLGANSVMGNNDSYISIQTSYGTLPNGINYGNYATIDDVVKDPTFGTPSANVQAKLDQISTMNIGGKDLRVLKSSNSTSIGYSFIYNGKSYGINFTAGSQTQYQADYSVFTSFLSSFKLL